MSEIRDLDKLNPELALEGEEIPGRVLELPDDEADEALEGAQGDELSEDELIDEEEAIALAKRPLDEILGVGQFERREDEAGEQEEDDADTDDESEPA